MKNLSDPVTVREESDLRNHCGKCREKENQVMMLKPGNLLNLEFDETSVERDIRSAFLKRNVLSDACLLAGFFIS